MKQRTKTITTVFAAFAVVGAITIAGVLVFRQTPEADTPPQSTAAETPLSSQDNTTSGDGVTPSPSSGTEGGRISNDELDEQMRNDFHGAYPDSEIDANGNVTVKNNTGQVIYTGKLDVDGKAILYDSNGKSVGEISVSGGSYTMNFYNGNFIQKR